MPPIAPKIPRPPSLHAIRRSLAERFAQQHLLSAEHPVDLLGVMIDKHAGESRVVVLVGPDSDPEALQELADFHFAGHPFKVVTIDQTPARSSGTASNGIAICRQGSPEFGTIGGWFKMDRDRHTGQPVDQSLFFGVSNNHVIGECNNSHRGDVLTDGNGVVVGRLHDLQALYPTTANAIDAAIFQVDPGIALQWQPAAPRGWTGAQINFRVYKQGARTGYTEGIVTGIGAIVAELCGVRYHFKDIIAIKGTDGEFSAEGDSGSIVLTRNHQMVGLLFAKSGAYAYAARIKELGAFNLRF